MSLEDLQWRLIEETPRTGPMHMALEEVAASTVAEGGPALVRTFRWSPSTLSMGYGQDSETVDWDYCSTAGIDVTRRQTGGGGIYHDHIADLSYSIVVPTEAVSGELMEAYHTLCEPILEFFDRIGIDATYASQPRDAVYEPACFLRDIHPAHDILVDGDKISGNAQYRQRDAVIQHGSLLFDNATDAHLSVFRNPNLDATQFETRTTTITDHVDIGRLEAISALTAALRNWAGATAGDWREDEIVAARELANTKYGSESWILDATGNST